MKNLEKENKKGSWGTFLGNLVRRLEAKLQLCKVLQRIMLVAKGKKGAKAKVKANRKGDSGSNVTKSHQDVLSMAKGIR